ncbi:MAG: alpha/beta hydrolase [Gammaproteobacteria bacterium]|nr:alpha/beta hydrolase [Gammaproteobacteria bacterium]
MLEYIEMNPRNAPRASVIWLHGLGADGHDFEGLVPELRLPDNLAIRFVLPHAPVRPISINGGMPMRGWYDLLPSFPDAIDDTAGIRASAIDLAALIEAEHARGIPYERIILAGFSQGGAIILHTGLRYPQRLGGLMVLSSYLPMAETLATERSAANADIPLLVAHGDDDPIVPLALGEQTVAQLQTLGYRPDFYVYPMPHSVCAEEVMQIRAWLIQRCTP